jgi:polyphosphate kinase 2 (PPK2 family)
MRRQRASDLHSLPQQRRRGESISTYQTKQKIYSQGDPANAVFYIQKGRVKVCITAGEIIIFDRSWYNRAGVEYVMGFCSEEEHQVFLQVIPQIEKYVVDAGITLTKIWLEVGKDEQERRFSARINDPLRQWKLSPMDLESYRRWCDYSRARDEMFEKTDSKHAPWYICARRGQNVVEQDKVRGDLPERAICPT